MTFIPPNNTLSRNLLLLLGFTVIIMTVWIGVRGLVSGPVTASLVAIIIPLAMVAVGRIWEGRWMTPFSSEMFLGYSWGDYLFLPIVAAMISLAIQKAGSCTWDSVWWITICAILAFTLGVGFHIIESRTWVDGVFHSPTKWFHDMVVMPSLAFLLLRHAPTLFSQMAEHKAVFAIALGALAIWLYLAVPYDIKHFKPKAHGAYNYKTNQFTQLVETRKPAAIK